MYLTLHYRETSLESLKRVNSYHFYKKSIKEKTNDSLNQS